MPSFVPFTLLLCALLSLSINSSATLLHSNVTHGHSFEMNSGSLGRSASTDARYEAISFDIHVRRPTLLWDEMAQKGLNLRVAYHLGNRAIIQITGNVDKRDYPIGAAIVIPDEAWNRAQWVRPRFEQIPSVPGMEADEMAEEDTLYFTITSVNIHQGRLAHLNLLPVSGGQILNFADVEIAPVHRASGRIGSVIFDRQHYNPPAISYRPPATIALGKSGKRSKPDTECFKLKTHGGLARSKTFDISKHAKLQVDTSVCAGIVEKFRLYWTKASFGYIFEAMASATLTVKGDWDSKGSGPILSDIEIPNMGINKKFPLLGRVKIGFFFKLDWVAEASAKAKFVATTSASYLRKERVDLRWTLQLQAPRQ